MAEQKINIGTMTQDEAQRDVEHAFSPFFVFRSPRKDEDKNEEVTDVLVPWDDLTLVIEVKAQALSPNDPRIVGAEADTATPDDPFRWARGKLKEAGRQVRSSVRAIRAGRMTEIENPLRGRVTFDEKQIKWLYGLIVLEHLSPSYDPFQLVPELEQTTVPLHIFSYRDFAELATLLDTPADLITYLETRSDVLLPTLKPKVHEEQQVFRYYADNLEDLQAFRAEKRGDNFTRDDARPYAENSRRLWNGDLPEAGLGAVVDDIIERAPENDPNLGPIHPEHEYEPPDSVKIATELSKIPRVRRIALGQGFRRTIWRADQEQAACIHSSYSKGRDECLLFLASPRPIGERNLWRQDLEMRTEMLKHRRPPGRLNYPNHYLYASAQPGSCLEQSRGFQLRPGICAAALEKIWAREISSSLRPDSQGPLVEIEMGGEFIAETRILLGRDEQGVHAEIFRVEGDPLCKQLEKLQDGRRYKSWEEATTAVEVLHRTVPGSDELSSIYNELSSLRIVLDPSDSIFFPARGYTVTIIGLTGKIEIQYAVPEPTADRVAYSGQTELPNQGIRDWVDRLLSHLKIVDGQTGKRTNR